jgi:hypothetical protein
MTLIQRFVRASLAALFVLLAVVEAAWTQATSAPAPLSAPPAATPEGGASNGLVAFAFVVGLLLITGIVVKVYDMKRKREDEAVALQARLSDAMLTEPSLAGLPITPTVEVPFGWHPQAVVTISGTVPTPELRAAALQLGLREMAPMRSEYRIEDRLFVDRMMARRAA